MPLPEARALWDGLNHSEQLPGRALYGAEKSVALDELARGTCLGGRLAELRGGAVLLATRSQLATAVALIEADGLARRLVLCPPDLALEHLSAVVATAEVDAAVTDRADVAERLAALGVATRIEPSARAAAGGIERGQPLPTEWILFTSGTTGVPKMVVHSLGSLAGAIRPGSALASPAVWCTHYDIRRFGGLQIFLRAVLGGGSLVLSSADEPLADFLERAGARGVTHMTGTPSHWRRVLMSPAARRVAPRYVRLSGEIADQAVLDSLAAFYSASQVSHAFASTEAGVAFEVDDGLAGFPAALVGPRDADVQLRVVDGTLRIRSPRMARRYLGTQDKPLVDAEGFIDTGDAVELRDGRYYFVGRRGGIINVGGLKVHPEEVEAVINRHPHVRMSLVKARKNPITGALVVAEVVLTPDAGDEAAVRDEVLAACREGLAAHKVPASIRFVPTLALTPAGKVARADA